MTTLTIILAITVSAAVYTAFRLVAWVQGTSDVLDWTPTAPFPRPAEPRPRYRRSALTTVSGQQESRVDQRNV